MPLLAVAQTMYIFEVNNKITDKVCSPKPTFFEILSTNNLKKSQISTVQRTKWFVQISSGIWFVKCFHFTRGCPNSSLLYFEHFDCNCNRHQYLRAIILHQTLLEIKNFGSSLRYAETNHERVFFSCMLPKQK